MIPRLERVDRSHARTRLAFMVLAGQYEAARSMIGLEPTLREWVNTPHRAFSIPDDLAERILRQAKSRLAARPDQLISWSRIPGHALWFMDPSLLAASLLGGTDIAPACLDADLIRHIVEHSAEYAKAFGTLPEGPIILSLSQDHASASELADSIRCLAEHPDASRRANTRQWLERAALHQNRIAFTNNSPRKHSR